MTQYLYDTPASTVAERRYLWLAASKDAGIPVRRAVITVATAHNESNTTRAVRRGHGLPFGYPDCSRQILRLERGQSGQPFIDSWQNDDELLAYLDSNGWTKRNGQGLWTASGGLDDYDSMEKPNTALATVFEYIIDTRRGRHLAAFSVGPTQIYLYYSPLVRDDPASSRTTGIIEERFPTWESLYAFWFSIGGIRGYMENTAFDYLRTKASNYPLPGAAACAAVPSDGGTCSSWPSNCVQSYLTCFQTGQVPWEDQIWASYASRFAQAVNECWMTANELGYT
jgi:hypothetical protein